MIEGSCGLRNHDDYHVLHSDCLVVLMPQASPVAFSLHLAWCSHSSVSGKNHATLSGCRAKLSVLRQLPLSLFLGNNTLNLSPFSGCCRTLFSSVFFLFHFLSFPSVPLSPPSPFSVLFLFSLASSDLYCSSVCLALEDYTRKLVT